jgi:hypothetical protein
MLLLIRYLSKSNNNSCSPGHARRRDTFSSRAKREFPLENKGLWASRGRIVPTRFGEEPESEGIWTKQVAPGEWKPVADAERLFKDIANAIRKEKGLEPVLQAQSVA